MTRQAQCGFTLVEMLVVFVLVGMLSVLLVEGFTYVLDLRGRFIREVTVMREGELQQSWFSDSVESLVVDLPSVHGHAFKGSPHAFSGLSLAALTSPAGVPRMVQWRLRSDNGRVSLVYSSRQRGPWKVLSWQGTRGTFRYLDARGAWHTHWPLQNSTDQQGLPQLPRAIAVRVYQSGKPRLWIAAPQAWQGPAAYLKALGG